MPVDLSGLIFVLLAVAWAGYLIPRALKRHDDDAANRPFEASPDTQRVLVRSTRLVPPPMLPADHLTLAERRAERRKLKADMRERRARAPRPEAGGAAVRRRRVLLVLVLGTAGTSGAASLGYVSWWWVALPGTLTVAWLLLGIRAADRERARARHVGARPAPREVAEPVVESVPVTSHEPVEVDVADELWDPVPLHVPTYVGKPVARRTVRTIELTDSSVSSGGHSAVDSALARRVADAAAAPAEERIAPQRRAAGA